MAETAVQNLADFLLARISEDEAGHNGHDYWCSWSQMPGGLCDCPRSRVLAEREAKRRVVALHSVLDEGYCYEDGSRDPCPTLRLLALPYADHRDYNEAWKP